MKTSFELFVNREIIDILIGDKAVYGEYYMPYYTGAKLCEMSTTFGLSREYSFSGGNFSRWMYMEDLIEFLNSQERLPELLAYLFAFERFEKLTSIGDPRVIRDTYKSIVDGAVQSINSVLLFSGKEFRIDGHSYSIVDIGQKEIIETADVRAIDSEYVNELQERIKYDLESKNYDSVITKSRTLLEEVFIYIIESVSRERYDSKGDMNKIYQKVTELLNMRKNSEYDKRINELLGGVNKIITAVSGLRNINSDAHGAGSGRVKIDKSEALLVARSSMMISDYVLSVYNRRK